MFVIAQAASTELPPNLFIQTGSKGQAWTISIEKVKQSLCLQYDINDMNLAAKSILYMPSPGVTPQVPFAAKTK